MMEAITISPRPIRMPGTMPDRKSPPMETLAVTPNMTMVMLGGMIGPINEEEAVTAAL